MHTFTHGSIEHIQAIMHAQTAAGGKYPMELNMSDFCTVLFALKDSADPAAHDLLSSIGETLGIEGV